MNVFYTDKQILTDLKSADEKQNNRALRYLYSCYYKMAFSIITKRGGNSAWVEEIFQDSIITFYESVKDGSFQQNSSIKTYLFAIIRNKWSTMLKKQDTYYGSTDFINQIEHINYDEELENQKIISSVVSKLLEELGDPCKSLLHYFYYEKHSMKDITFKMNYKNEMATKSQKYNCLQRLIRSVDNKPELKKILIDAL